ncbi:MAG: GNAT family N-acetyltransferase, partial [Dehalococcoidia bacterium]|nr:GNAT family N-acetyltransferase [Dehalococcoidia bacterium]
MARVTVRPFERGDLDAAAALLAEKHRRDRERHPVLTESLADEGEARSMLAKWFDNERTDGAVAVDGDALAGYAIGERAAGAPPDSYMGQLSTPRSVSIGSRDHAVADAYDANAVCRVLYRHLAAKWVATGYYSHSVSITAGDERLQEAWFNLGFGRHVSIAVREGTGPVAGADARDVDVRAAGSEDVGELLELARTLGLHHLDSPMFMYWPVQAEYDGLARTFFGGLLEDEGNPHFVAYREGQAVGLTSFLKQGFIPPYVNAEKNVYLFMGIVEPEAQDGGVGRALLDRGMAWAREEGYERCTLHVLSANYSGEP